MEKFIVISLCFAGGAICLMLALRIIKDKINTTRP